MATKKATRSSSKSGSGSGTGKSRSTGTSGRSASRTNRELTDHEEIRSWAEERGAVPSCVKKTGGEGDVGMIRLDFPGYSGEDTLQKICWDDWFEKFDENNLALIVQDTTSRGQKSNFNKLVKRTSQARPKTRAAH